MSLRFFQGIQIHYSECDQDRVAPPGALRKIRALLHNGEKVYISRQYVPVLKRKLGL